MRDKGVAKETEKKEAADRLRVHDDIQKVVYTKGAGPVSALMYFRSLIKSGAERFREYTPVYMEA